MFNSEFFPTPEPVIRKMLDPFLYQKDGGISQLTILEPSAGSGAILDFIDGFVKRNNYSNKQGHQRLYCCEIDPNLKATLHGKNYRVIADNFLQYNTDYFFDLIAMNPPFSNGDQHVLHAWETVANGGHVVALLNAETLRNPYTQTRQQLARLVEDHGSAEYIGRAFLTAERRTDVEVVLVRLQKPAGRDRLNFKFKTVTRETGAALDEHTFRDTVATRDVIGNMQRQYTCLKDAFEGLLEAQAALDFYSQGLLDPKTPRTIQSVARESIEAGGGNPRNAYNAFSDAMKQHIWGLVLERVNIQRFMTDAVRQNFAAFTRQQGCLDFTTENVAELVAMLINNSGTILEQAIVDVFDELTAYHAENRLHVEGWKTNSKWKVNRKIILPNVVSYGDYRSASDLKRYGSSFGHNGSRYSKYSDIDKALCYITGDIFPERDLTPADQARSITTIYAALSAQYKRLGTVRTGEEFNATCESHFFNLRFFKKGTLHLEFKDEKLWEEFNLRACAGKLWLPEPEMRAYQNRKKAPYPGPATPAPTLLLG